MNLKRILLKALLVLVCYSSALAQLNLQWQDLGPDNLGGPVRGLIIDNRDTTRQTLYAGVMGGGVWKTTDGAVSWNYLGCTGNYAISCLAQASNGTVYIGTGDGIEQVSDINTEEGHPGNGIYKLDTIDNFIHLDATAISNSNYYSCWGAVNQIAINPTNVGQLIAANNCGLYQSNDSGNSWRQISIQGMEANLPVLDIKWSNDGSNILASIGGAFSSKMVRSNDTGTSWNVIDSSNTGFPKAGLGRTTIAFAPSNSNIAYLSIADGEPSIGEAFGVIKTTDGGITWDKVILGSSGFTPFGDGQGWYDNAIAVSPANPDDIYVGGAVMYSYSPQTGPRQLPPFIYTSVLAGYYIEQFMYVINDLNPDEMYIASNRGVFKSIHALADFDSVQFSAANNGLRARDFISIAAANNGRVIGGSLDDECLLISNIGSESFSNLNTGRGYCYFSHLDTNYAFMENYYGSVYVGNNSLTSFYTAFDTSIDPAGSGYPSSCGQYDDGAQFMAPFYLHETKSAFATIDMVPFIANTSFAAGDVIEVISKTANTVFQYTLSNSLAAGDTLQVPDPVKSNLFLSTFCGVWMKQHAVALTSGRDWYKITTAAGDATCFAASKDGNTLYWGNYDGSVQHISGLNFVHFNSDSMIDSFQTISNTISNKWVNSATIEGIAVDPNNDSILLVAVGGYTYSDSTNIYKSTDAGQTWKAGQIGPIGLPAYTCVIDANNSNNYIVGTEHGIWTSNDAGATWQQDDANMCDVPVYQLQQIPLLADDCYVLYAATNSRGLWRTVTLTPSGCNTLPDLTGINYLTSDLLADDIRLFPNPATNYTDVQFSLTTSQQITIRILDITGRLVQTAERFLPAGAQQIELNTSLLNAGTYLVNIEAGQTSKTKLLVVAE